MRIKFNAIARSKLVVAIGALLFLSIAMAWLGGVFTQKIAPGLNQSTTQLDSQLISKQSSQEGSQNGAVGFAVQVESVASYESLPGTISADQATLISSRILARITTISVRAGETVRQNQILAQLEKSDLEARAKQSSEQVKAVEARALEAQQNLARIQTLLSDGVVSRADFDKATANQNALAADLAAAKLAFTDAQAALSYTEIRAPIAGRVVDRFAEPGDTATPGKTLLSIYNPLSLQVEAQVREQLALTLRLGDAVGIEIPALQKSLPAVVEEIVPAADTGSRSFRVKARFEYDATLMPGMYARLILPVGLTDQIAIPSQYLAEVGQLDVVWVMRGDQVERRFVKAGKKLADDRIEIVSGLAAGDVVVLPVSLP